MPSSLFGPLGNENRVVRRQGRFFLVAHDVDRLGEVEGIAFAVLDHDIGDCAEHLGFGAEDAVASGGGGLHLHPGKLALEREVYVLLGKARHQRVVALGGRLFLGGCAAVFGGFAAFRSRLSGGRTAFIAAVPAGRRAEREQQTEQEDKCFFHTFLFSFFLGSISI